MAVKNNWTPQYRLVPILGLLLFVVTCSIALLNQSRGGGGGGGG